MTKWQTLVEALNCKDNVLTIKSNMIWPRATQRRKKQGLTSMNYDLTVIQNKVLIYFLLQDGTNIYIINIIQYTVLVRAEVIFNMT